MTETLSGYFGRDPVLLVSGDVPNQLNLQEPASRLRAKAISATGSVSAGVFSVIQTRKRRFWPVPSEVSVVPTLQQPRRQENCRDPLALSRSTS